MSATISQTKHLYFKPYYKVLLYATQDLLNITYFTCNTCVINVRAEEIFFLTPEHKLL